MVAGDVVITVGIFRLTNVLAVVIIGEVVFVLTGVNLGYCMYVRFLLRPLNLERNLPRWLRILSCDSDEFKFSHISL